MPRVSQHRRVKEGRAVLQGVAWQYRDGADRRKERKVKVDDEYIEHYIEHPNVDIVKGYPAIMPVIPVTESELEAIAQYLKTVK